MKYKAFFIIFKQKIFFEGEKSNFKQIVAGWDFAKAERLKLSSLILFLHNLQQLLGAEGEALARRCSLKMLLYELFLRVQRKHH